MSRDTLMQLAGCESLVCTTCGGFAGLPHRLEAYRANGNDLVSELARLPEYDRTEQFPDDVARKLVNAVRSGHEAHRLSRAWLEEIRNNPATASRLVEWLPENARRFADLREFARATVLSEADILPALERVRAMLVECRTSDRRVPATELFNEGWMLRLVLDWAQRHPDSIEALPFLPGSRWYSEALLASRFAPRHRGDMSGEGFTHADAVIGHFKIGSSGRGDIELLPGARQFTVVEAKMASGLSPGTVRAPTFHQAARNLACIAHLVTGAGIPPSAMRLGFVVLAPRARFAMFQRRMELDGICEAVKARAEAYDAEAQAWWHDHFMSVARVCSISLVAWEDVLDGIAAIDPMCAEPLRAFYANCLHFNPFHLPPARRPGPATN